MSLEPITGNDLVAEIGRLHVLLTGKSEYVDCHCPGCPRKVPEVWSSGMCQPCCDEDCEHADGARRALAAMTAERDEAKVFEAAALATVATSNEIVKLQRAEIDRLHAALEPTDENVKAIADEYVRVNGYRVGYIAIAHAFVTAIRARAGLAVKP